MKSTFPSYFSNSEPDLSAPLAATSGDDPSMFSSKRLSQTLPALRALVPHRVRRKWRATKTRIRSTGGSHGGQTTASITSLQTSFSPADTLRSLRHHRWSYYDGQYLLLLIIAVFCISIIDISPLIKTSIATLLCVSLILPITRQFFLPAMPIFGWLVLFYSCKFIPGHYRPGIWVRVLPTLENILYGANLSNILSKNKHVVLDVLAWLPYGITHFGAPVVCSAIMFIWGPPKYTAAFARTFGYMNIAGVVIQLIFPCSPPWYENMYGLAPADYTVKGSPAGLARIDQLFGIDMYTTPFTASPQVFGAFPSLHSGNASLEALFMANLFPKLTPLFTVYVMWLWWSTMYLSHHYAVDLVGGSLLAAAFFFVCKAKFLPRVQSDKPFRWSYDYIEIGEAQDNYYSLNGGLPFYEEFQNGHDSDEWTIGSTSSFSSRSRSPSSVARGSTDTTSLWEGDTLASSSDEEKRADARMNNSRRISTVSPTRNPGPAAKGD